MAGPIAQYLGEDHKHLDALLEQAVRQPGTIDVAAFEQFRKGLLRHIGLEERIVFPAARQAVGGDVAGLAQLRADHSKLVAMLVPTPTPAGCAALRALLDTHNRAEEEPSGVYQRCEELLKTQLETIVARLRDAGEVPVRPFQDRRVPTALRTNSN